MGLAKYQTRTWHVYNDLLRLISSGEFESGARLDEQQIAEELGVSRTPVREAVTQLVRDGIVENRPYRGNYVRSFSAKQVFDLYEVRKALESTAVRLAIPKLTDSSKTKLRSILAEVERALQAEDIEAYSRADQDFHETIVRITENETLMTTLRRLAGQVQLARIMANRSPDVVELAALERPGIVDAMEQGDIALATSLMEEHIEMVQHNIMMLMTLHETPNSAEDGLGPENSNGSQLAIPVASRSR